MPELIAGARHIVSRPLRKLARVAGSRRDIEPRLVWILGSPRSGSTWLLRMLEEHETVVGVNEPLIGSHLGPILPDLRGVGLEFFDSQNFTLRGFDADNPNHFFAEEYRGTWLPSLGALIRERFRAHALAHAPAARLWRAFVVIQEPNGSQSADVLMAALPRARFIFLLRDGRDVVDSQLAANNPGAWVSKAFTAAQGLRDDERREFLIRTAHKWLWTTEVVQQAFAAHPGPKRLVRYEDLRKDPVGELRGLLEWLGLRHDWSWLETLVERHSFDRIPQEWRGEREFARAAKPGLWRQNLSPDEQRVLHEILGGKLDELGYEVQENPDAVELS